MKKENTFKVKSRRLDIIPSDTGKMWNKPWDLNDIKKKTVIGKVNFKGIAENYAIQIEITIKDQYKNQGYEKETLEAMCNWVLGKENIYIVESQIDREDKETMKHFESAGFVKDKVLGRKVRFIKTRMKMPWLIICLSMFISGGVAVGFTAHNVALWTIIGAVAGIVVGSFFNWRTNSRARKAEKEWRGSK